MLPFRIDYVNTVKTPESIADKQVSAIDKENALLAVERVRQVVAYILEHFDQKTKRAEHYRLSGKRVHGFNALFATASIDAARRYYNQFFLQQQDLPPDQRLKVGLIYSYAANEAETDDLLAEEEFDTDALDKNLRAQRRRHSSRCSARSCGCATSSRPSTTSPATRSSHRG